MAKLFQILGIIVFFVSMIYIIRTMKKGNAIVIPPSVPTEYSEVSETLRNQVNSQCSPGCTGGCNQPLVAGEETLEKFRDAGLDPDKVAICNSVYYYDDVYTCVASYLFDNSCATLSCSPNVFGPQCGAADTVGNIDCRIRAIKTSVENGLDAVKCPRLQTEDLNTWGNIFGSS